MDETLSPSLSLFPFLTESQNNHDLFNWNFAVILKEKINIT